MNTVQKLIDLHQRAICRLEMIQECDRELASQKECDKNYTKLFGHPLDSTVKRIAKLEITKPRIKKSYTEIMTTLIKKILL